MKDLHQQKIFKDFSAVETKAADGASRTLIVKISSPNADRSRDTVDQMGVVVDNYMKNPVVLFAHNYSDMPIAKCVDLKVAADGIIATVEFPPEGVYAKADVIYQMYKGGFLNAWSIGFMPLEYEENAEGGYAFKKWEMFEFSSVPVPDNPEALTVMRSKGIDVDLLKEKDADASTELEYTDETKIMDLTVGQLKTLIEKAGSVSQYDEHGNLLVKIVSNVDGVEKSGRAISAKHEELLKSAHSCIAEVLKSIETEPDADDGKAISQSNSMIKRLTASLKTTDKSVGLTLRLLKTIESERGGEKIT